MTNTMVGYCVCGHHQGAHYWSGRQFTFCERCTVCGKRDGLGHGCGPFVACDCRGFDHVLGSFDHA